jgi:hypothetical protein
MVQIRWMNACTGCQTKPFDCEGQAVLDGTLPRGKERGMPIAKKDETGADLGATATAAFPPLQISVFLLSKILLLG